MHNRSPRAICFSFCVACRTTHSGTANLCTPLVGDPSPGVVPLPSVPSVSSVPPLLLVGAVVPPCPIRTPPSLGSSTGPLGPTVVASSPVGANAGVSSYSYSVHGAKGAFHTSVCMLHVRGWFAFLLRARHRSHIFGRVCSGIFLRCCMRMCGRVHASGYANALCNQCQCANLRHPLRPGLSSDRLCPQ